MDAAYERLCTTPSDINEHLPTLYGYAKQCERVLELGVRGVVSSWAIAKGLAENEKAVKSLHVNDLEPCAIDELVEVSGRAGVTVTHEWKNDLELEVSERVDMTFIDTWHVYGQMKRELEKFSGVTDRYIVMHDTTVDEWMGETIRCLGGYRAAEIQARQTGIPIPEIMRGVWPAIQEFLETHGDEWRLKERFTNNNGLTVLERTATRG